MDDLYEQAAIEIANALEDGRFYSEGFQNAARAVVDLVLEDVEKCVERLLSRDLGHATQAYRDGHFAGVMRSAAAIRSLSSKGGRDA